MATKNRRVATYLPPDIDGKFKEFKERNSIEGDSEALIRILRDYLGVAHQESEVSYLVLPDLLKRVEALESAKFVTQDQLSEFMAKVTKDIALAIAKESRAQDSELGSVSGDEPLQTDLAIELEQSPVSKDEGHGIPEELMNGLSQSALAKRLGVNRKKISRRRDSNDFAEWSMGEDSDGIAWKYRVSNKKYYPFSY